MKTTPIHHKHCGVDYFSVINSETSDEVCICICFCETNGPEEDCPICDGTGLNEQ